MPVRRSTEEGSRFNRTRNQVSNNVLTSSPQTPAQAQALRNLPDSSLITIIGGAAGAGSAGNPLLRDVLREHQRRGR